MIVTLAAYAAPDAMAQSATAKNIKGKVQVIHPGKSKAIPLKNGDKIPPGATIITKGKAKAVVQLTTGSAVQVSEKSEMQIVEVKNGTANSKPKARIKLRSGTAAALIREKSKMDFKIETPHGIAAARGTFYAVTVKGGKTHAAVREGKINVTSKEKP